MLSEEELEDMKAHYRLGSPENRLIEALDKSQETLKKLEIDGRNHVEVAPLVLRDICQAAILPKTKEAG